MNTLARACPPGLCFSCLPESLSLLAQGVVGSNESAPVMRCVESLLENLPHEPWYKGLFEAGAGKMFGVLLCRSGNSPGNTPGNSPRNEPFYLSGFSGLLAGAWSQPGFVPPVCDVAAVTSILQAAQTDIDAFDAKINNRQTHKQLREKLAALADLEQEARSAIAAMQTEMDKNKRLRAVCRQQMEGDLDALRKLGHQSSDDRKRLKLAKQQWLNLLDVARRGVAALQGTQADLKQARALVSRNAQQQVFSHYALAEPGGSRTPLASFFPDQLPPSGAGDCAAPKLLHYANSHDLEILALAEFWVGTPPSDGVRRHGVVYPPCRGKCQPILPYLSGGVELMSCPVKQHEVSVLYEDDSLAVLEKPAGVLSVPGKTETASVYTQLLQRYPEAEGPLLVHRLDMDTSGILLMAKTQAAHKHLQRQFIRRKVVKEYIAVLDGNVLADSGEVNLPLRVDLQDRPRQLVCHEHGKPALTRFRVLERMSDAGSSRTRILFLPETGRTHQLRVHSAHTAGLDAPVTGDPLYGNGTTRMHLHASHLAFDHPTSGKRISIDSEAPF